MRPSSPDPVPKAAEPFVTVHNHSESFGRIPNGSEGFRTVPHLSERKEDHTLTVREVARMFEAAGVARTERSITNWCQPNKLGVARLDAYFDPNERRYFITPQSAERAIGEEKAKATKGQSSEPVESIPKASEVADSESESQPTENIKRVRELERENMDLRIANRGKDYFIEELRKERQAFGTERQGYVEQLMNFNRKVGELESKLLQLGAGQNQEVQTDGEATKH
jgi:hypothetical protein